MKLALVTTTINVPEVLKLYAATMPSSLMFKIFIATDKKTQLGTAFGDALKCDYWLGYGSDWKCSELIGWNSIQRRNIAFLEALKQGADIIVSVDDDNIQTGTSGVGGPALWFMSRVLEYGFSGLSVSCDPHWFDVGQLLVPCAKHRGFPHNISSKPSFGHVVNARVGVAAGICLGDPDIDATTRMVNHPQVHQISEVLRAGVVVDFKTRTVFNSQNTAILRKFVPAWGMIPFVGRFDDIYASLVCQRVMREHDYLVHFGQPFVIQQRNQHDLVKDLRGEIDGYENVEKLACILDSIFLTGKSVIDDCRRIWDTLAHTDFIPARSVEAMQTYVDDCETVL